MDFTLKDWLAAEKSLRLYNRHRVLYYIFAFWLFFQSVVAFLVFLALILAMCLGAYELESARLGVFAFICIASSLWGYVGDMLTNPCKGLFHLNRRKYKRLYESVNEISRNIKGPKIHAIYISNDFNAAATSRRVFGLFRRNILILGFPALCSLDRKGLTGCLAHEIGHLKHNHISVAGWLRMVQVFWINVHLGFLTIIFIPWLRYWLPALNNLARPVFRKHEIEADEYIIESFGGDYSAACQVELALKSKQYSDVMDILLEQFREESWPQFDYARFLRDELRKNLPLDKADKLLQRAMRTVDNVMDEHPSFADRLKMAGCTYPRQYCNFDADALDYFLAPNDALYSELNAYFHAELDPTAECYRSYVEEAQKWLNDNPPSTDMGKNKIIDALANLAIAGEKERRKTFLDNCLRADPANPQLRALHALDIAQDDPDQARVILEECIAQSPTLYFLDENNFLVQSYMETGDTERLKACLKLREGRMETLQENLHAKLSEKDALECYEISPMLQKEICETLKTNFKEIARAYGVKRPVDSKTSYCVLFIVLEYKALHFRWGQSSTDILNALQINNHTVVIKTTKYCQQYLEPIPGACFYCRDTYVTPKTEKGEPTP